MWNNDNELFKIAKQELFVALVGDVLDKLGLGVLDEEDEVQRKRYHIIHK